MSFFFSSLINELTFLFFPIVVRFKCLLCLKKRSYNLTLISSLFADGIQIDKADLVTTHTARRSFATNAYRDEENIPIIDIMMITGHKTEVEFLKYIVISPEEHAMRLARKYKRFS